MGEGAMRIGRALVWAFGLNSFMSFSGLVSAQDLEAQTKALGVISAFAAETCGNPVPLEGGRTHLELSGDVKAQLAGVIAKVVDLGGTAAAKYANDEYKNVLHEQLAQTLKDASNCRLEVFKLLQEKMIVQR